MIVRKLSEVCIFKPQKKQARLVLKDTDQVSFLQMEDLGIYSKHVVSTRNKLLSEVYKCYTYFKEGDILLAKITPCFENGKMAIANGLTNGIGFGSTEFLVIRCLDDVLNEWIFRFLTLPYVRDEGRDLMTGAVGHKRIPLDYIQSLLVPIPSINEQKRILFSLESQLDEISKCESKLEQQLVLLKKLEISMTYEALGLIN